MEFGDVVDELYRRAPAEFTAARDRAVTAARAAKDSELAKRIGALRKPTASAWLANLLVRERGEQVEELLQLGAAMRDAQQSLAGKELMTLSRQRHRVIAALGAEARRLAAAAGHPVASAAGTELEETLGTALADEAAAGQLREARLTTALKPDQGGFGSAGGDPPARLVSPPAEKMTSPERTRVAAAAEAVRAAEQAAAAADRNRSAAEAAVQRQDEAERELRRQRTDLEAALRRVRAEESLAHRELIRLQAQAATAAKAAESAGRRLADARARRDRLDA